MSNDISSAPDADQAEIDRYEKAYRETRRALDEAIELLALLKHFETDLDAASDIGEDILELKKARVDLVRANFDFHAGRAVMMPPSPELVDEIIANTKVVVELTVEKATASKVVTIATKALGKFAEIQDIG